MFSIIIPLYNKAHTIEKTIQSVLDQTFQEFEMIIVNDGSTDEGVSKIQRFKKDSRIKLVDQLNEGVSVARNNGVLLSNYDLIAFLDGDDEWLPDYLQKMKEAIEAFPDAGMYCCAGFNKDNTGQYLRVARKYKGKTLKIDFFENPGVFIHTSATIVRKSHFKTAGGFPVGMKRNQDFALFFTIALISPVVYCGFPLSIYNGGIPGQTTSTPSNLVINHIINRFNHVHGYYTSKNIINSTYIIYLKYELRHQIISYLRKNDFISIKEVISLLDKEIVKLFSTYEISLYSNKKNKSLSIAYIYFTKIRWRLRGFPRVH